MGEIEKKRGRIPGWKNPERLDRIIDAIEKGNFQHVAAAAAGVAYNTLYTWLQQAQEEDAPPELVEFAQRFEVARAAAEQKAVEHLWKVADGGHLVKRRTGYTKNGDEYVEEEFTPPVAQPIQFLLERGFANRWGRRQTLALDPQQDSGAAPTPTPQGGGDGLTRLAERLAEHLALTRGEADITDAEIVEES